MIKIKVKCECGNKVYLTSSNKKMVIVQDNLEKQRFYLDKSDIHKGEIIIRCCNCKRWITLSL